MCGWKTIWLDLGIKQNLFSWLASRWCWYSLFILGMGNCVVLTRQCKQLRKLLPNPGNLRVTHFKRTKTAGVPCKTTPLRPENPTHGLNPELMKPRIERGHVRVCREISWSVACVPSHPALEADVGDTWPTEKAERAASSKRFWTFQLQPSGWNA